MKTKIKIPDFKLGPFMILEGGRGLDGLEEEIHHLLIKAGNDVWVLDDLYEKGERLASIGFLKPKTIILGTTGLYKEKLGRLIDLFFDLELDSIENVILTLNSEDALHYQMEKLKILNRGVKFFKYLGEGGGKFEFYEI